MKTYVITFSEDYGQKKTEELRASYFEVIGGDLCLFAEEIRPNETTPKSWRQTACFRFGTWDKIVEKDVSG